MKGYKLLIILIFGTVTLMAQGNDPGLPGGDPDVPIDGGLGFLIIAGIAYGAKKVREL
jgi:hypothetical protein